MFSIRDYLSLCLTTTLPVAIQTGLRRTCLMSLALPVLLACNNASAQNPYPSTQYSGFGAPANFATNRSFQPDSTVAGRLNDHRSMSPDSWENPASGVLGSGPIFPAPIATPLAANSNNQFPTQTSAPATAPANLASASPGRPNQIQNASYPLFEKGQLPVTLSNGPQVPGNIRQQDPIPAAAVRPHFSNATASPRQEFPILEPATAGQLDSDFQSSPTNRSIIRTPHEALPAPPTNPWSYPDSRTTASGPTIPGAAPNFRTDLGHRDADPTRRNFGLEDDGQNFDFEEKKKQYPKLGEILATGRYFGSGSILYLKPSFTGNTSIAQTNSGNAETFDFDLEAAPQFQIGFESKYGPGVELTYWQYDETSNDSTFTSNGIETGTTSAWMMGSNQWSRLSASNNGDTLLANHTIDVESIGATFFKEVKLPISRINGKFGMQYVSITHDMNATLTDSGATQIGSLKARSDMRAYGPQFRFEYFRPVGHTKIEFMTALGGSAMFGRQDQFVVNSATGNLSRIGADEFLTTIDFFSGVQYRKMIAENRNWFVRGGFNSQAWLNGGNAILPQDDFGLRGITFSVGYNR